MQNRYVYQSDSYSVLTLFWLVCDSACVVIVMLSLIIGILVVFLLGIGLYYGWKQMRRLQRRRRVIPELLMSKPTPTLDQLLEDPSIPLIPPTDITRGAVIAAGSQGLVWYDSTASQASLALIVCRRKGSMKHRSSNVDVAVKQVRQFLLLVFSTVC